jgi:hypothetical protein
LIYQGQRGMPLALKIPDLEGGSMKRGPVFVLAAALIPGGFAWGALAWESAELPSGTALSVSTSEPIEATAANAGKIFNGVLYHDVVDDNGNVLIPKSSPVRLVARRVRTDGPVGGKELVVDLESISVNGNTYSVGKRHSDLAPGGAAATLVGLIAGVGAEERTALSVSTEVLMRGNEIRIPAQSILTFRLDEPLRIQS